MPLLFWTAATIAGKSSWQWVLEVLHMGEQPWVFRGTQNDGITGF
jgi:hypothetical protein